MNSLVISSQQLAEALSVKVEEFDLTQDAQAVYFQSQQVQLWNQLVGQIPNVDNGANYVRNHLTNTANNPATFRIQRTDRIRVTGQLPLLSKERVAVISEYVARNPMQVLGALLAECAPTTQNAMATQVTVNLLVNVVQYLTGGIWPKDYGKITGDLQGAIDGANQERERVDKQAKQEIDDRKKLVEKFIADRSAELEAFKGSLAEDIKFKSSSALWSSRAWWHRTAFLLWAGIFVLIVFVAILYLKTHLKELWESLPHETNGNYPYISVVLILIPTLGLAWVLRIVSRFINNNQILADDARHREVMTKTYLALLQDRQSGVTENDRLVMLSAIFRPLPGAQVEEVAPPTILDLLKKGQ